jgi:hypothetical protein
MTLVADVILGLFRDAWIALLGGLLIFSFLALLGKVLKVATASTLGASVWIWEALSMGFALCLLILFAYLGVPVIYAAAQNAIPVSGGCGPIESLSTLAAGSIAALGALRILKALAVSLTIGLAGGCVSLSGALLETGEAIFGMIVASSAIPLAASFLGVC